MKITDKQKRAAKRLVKGFMASGLATIVSILATNAFWKDTSSAPYLIPYLTAFFLGLEKLLQKEEV